MVRPLLITPPLRAASLCCVDKDLFISIEENDLAGKIKQVQAKTKPGPALFSLYPGIYLGKNQTGLAPGRFSELKYEPLTFRNYSIGFFKITTYSPPETWWYNMDYEVRYVILARKAKENRQD